MIPDEKFGEHYTVTLVTEDEYPQKQQSEQQKQFGISLSAFGEIYNEYLSDHSEVETASIETDTLSSASIANTKKESNNHRSQPNIRIHNNQLFGVQLEVNFLLLEAERRKLKVLQQELDRTLANCDKLERDKKQTQPQSDELLLAIS